MFTFHGLPPKSILTGFSRSSIIFPNLRSLVSAKILVFLWYIEQSLQQTSWHATKDIYSWYRNIDTSALRLSREKYYGLINVQYSTLVISLREILILEIVWYSVTINVNHTEGNTDARGDGGTAIMQVWQCQSLLIKNL